MSAIFVQREAKFLIRKRTSSSSLILSTTLVSSSTQVGPFGKRIADKVNSLIYGFLCQSPDNCTVHRTHSP